MPAADLDFTIDRKNLIASRASLRRPSKRWLEVQAAIDADPSLGWMRDKPPGRKRRRLRRNVKS